MSVEESEELGSLDAIGCIRCNGDIGRRKLLVCAEIGCPIAIHEECMCSEPVVDQLGNFYCPYCAYKREIVRTRELNRRAVRLKSSLSKFIDAEDRNGGGRAGGQVGGHCVEGENSECREGGDAWRTEIEDRGNGGDNVGCRDEWVTEGIGETQDNVLKGNLDQPCVSEGNEFEDVQDEERVNDAQQEVEIVEETPPEDVDPGNVRYVEEKTDKENVYDGLEQEDENEENIGKSENEEQKQPEGKEVPADRTVVSESDEPDTGSPLVRKSKRFKQKAQKKVRPQNVTSSRTVPSPSRESLSPQESDVEEVPKNEKEKAKTSSEKKRVTEEFQRKLVNPNGQRKRLNWTDEELDMLKEGLRIYGSEDKKTPWKQILEYGRNVFHETRESVDLRDKWRRSIAKKPRKR